MGNLVLLVQTSVPKYISLYNNEQREDLKMKPGITGWAQINGICIIFWKKFDLDIWYIENFNFLLDLKIIISYSKFLKGIILIIKKIKK